MYITFIDKESKEIVTRSTDLITPSNVSEIEKNLIYIYDLYDEAKSILSQGDINKRYNTIYIPKKNGKKRRIDIPDESLKIYMRKFVSVFTKKLHFIFPKPIYAYVEKRSTKQMAEVHKNAYSIMKFDLKNFFPNCTLQFILNSMEEIYPFCLFNSEILETIVKACMIEYDGTYRLPQGAPSSPFLSNVAMIPIDLYISFYIREDAIYTRFADDIFISHHKVANKDTFLSTEQKILHSLESFNKELDLNSDKTKFLKTKYGEIRMLGLTVGQNVCIGNKKKQILKATIWSFLMDAKNNKVWSKERTYKMIGFIGYCKYIEPNFVNMIIDKYEQKTGMNYHNVIKTILCPRE